MFKAIFILITAFFIVNGQAQANSGLFTKVDTWTLSAVVGIKNYNTSAINPLNIAIEGFTSQADCEANALVVKSRTYESLSYAPPSTGWFAYSCHKTKAIVPVVEITPPVPVN